MADIFELFKKISGNTERVVGKPEYIIVGLGNPGIKYSGTRHNAGFDAIDRIAEKYNVKIINSKFKALVASCVIAGKNVILMKPQTFMNLSGEAVLEASGFYKISPEKIIVISDDICLEPGNIRIKRNGSAGGHNGLSDIITKLGSDKFIRIKIGVGGKPNPEYDLADWVLGKPNDEEIKLISERHDDIIESAELILSDKTDDAMGRFNGKKAGK